MLAFREALRGPIPAGAGETSARATARRRPRAYPRWRGGNAVVVEYETGIKGLSPLARGKPDLGAVGHVRGGPIPAGAGETARARRRAAGMGAYPRWRGGNGGERLALADQRGLSPLARGKLAQLPRLAGAAGPIPAGAGETHAVRGRCPGAGAYPRWRGGNQ